MLIAILISLCLIKQFCCGADITFSDDLLYPCRNLWFQSLLILGTLSGLTSPLFRARNYEKRKSKHTYVWFGVDIATCPLRNRLVINQLLIVWQHTVCVNVQITTKYYNKSKCWLHLMCIAILKHLCLFKQFWSGRDITF
jgi:hypothetical protein